MTCFRIIFPVVFFILPIRMLSVEPENLRFWADQKSFNIGCAIDHDLWSLNPNGGFMQAVMEHNMVVAGNRMKMSAVQPVNGQFNFGWGDQFIDFAEENNMSVRGHVLVYFIPYQLPAFLKEAFDHNAPFRERFNQQLVMSADQLENLPAEEIIHPEDFSRLFVDADSLYSLMKSHIKTIVDRYKGRVKEWDVFNEYFDDFNQIWKGSDIGHNMMDSIFHWAHEADPDALLFYTDYHIEQWDPFSTNAKSRRAYNLVKGMLERGVPIHGVGFQSHFEVGRVNFDRVSQSVEMYHNLGLNVSFCEVDFTIPLREIENASFYEKQALDYSALIDIALRNENISTFVLWGVGDRDSWRASQNPLVWDRSYRKKPAYFALLNRLAGVDLAIAKPPAEDNILFWPNPSSELVYINDVLQVATAELLNFNGVSVLYSSPVGNQIDITSLKSGLYMLRLTDIYGQYYTSKLMIAR